MIDERELSAWARRAFGDGFRLRTRHCVMGHVHFTVFRIYPHGQLMAVSHTAAIDWRTAARRLECRMFMMRTLAEHQPYLEEWAPVLLAPSERERLRHEATVQIIAHGSARAARRAMLDSGDLNRLVDQVAGEGITYLATACGAAARGAKVAAR